MNPLLERLRHHISGAIARKEKEAIEEIPVKEKTAFLQFGGAFTGNPQGPYLTIEVPVKESPLWFHKQGLMQTATGYGRKLTSSKMVYWEGRWRRVYVCCYSNSGTAYILRNGKPLATVTQ